MRKFILFASFVFGIFAIPVLALAAEGYAIATVNLRAGPSTGYPVVTVIPAGAPVTIYGCMQSPAWCDTSYRGIRGWVSGRYLQALYQQRRVYVGPEYYAPLGIPLIGFSFDTYWDRYYRDRPFYRDRDRWHDYYEGRPYRPPGYRPRPERPPAYRPPARPERPPEYRPPGQRPPYARPPHRPEAGRPPQRPPNFRPPGDREPGMNRPPPLRQPGACPPGRNCP